MKTRVGLLGGTFNPIHKGHIELGTRIKHTFHLDHILYILSANPPHKKNLEIAPAELRWKMLTKALEPYPYLIPSDIEMKRPLASWTIDTIRELQRQNPLCSYYFISGSEGFLKIKTWKNYRQLLHLIPFIVVLRDQHHKIEVETLLREDGISSSFVDLNATDEPRLEQDAEHAPAIYFFSYRSDYLPFSSTIIRSKIKLSEPIDHMVLTEVKKIMEENNLYEYRGI